MTPTTSTSSEHTVAGNVTAHFEGIPFEFFISTTIYAELLHIESPYSSLPESAEFLTFGKEHTRIVSEADAYQKLFKYRLPLVFSGILEDEGCASLMHDIRERRAALGIAEGSIETVQIGDEWTKNLYRFVLNKSKAKNFHNVEFLQFTARIVTRDPQNAHSAFSILGNNKFALAEPVLFDLLDKGIVLHESHKASAYSSLRGFPSEKNKALLHRHFSMPQTNECRTAIIQALTPYTDEATYQLLLQHYRQNFNDLDSVTGAELIRALGNFQTPETEKILWDALLYQENNAGNFVFDILKKQGISDEQLAKRIKPVFEKSDNPAQHLKFLSYFSVMEDPALMPSQASILLLFERIFKEDDDPNLVYSMPEILAKNMDDFTTRRLTLMLEDPNLSLKKAVMIQISCLGNHPKFNPPPRMQEYLLEMFQAEAMKNSTERHTEMFEMYGQSLSALTPKMQDTSICKPLTEIAMSGEWGSQASAMKTMNALFINREVFDEVVLPLYVPLLRSPDPHIRKLAVEGLKWCPKPEVAMLVNQLKNDPDDDVKRAVVGWMNMPRKKYAPSIDFKISEDLSLSLVNPPVPEWVTALTLENQTKWFPEENPHRYSDHEGTYYKQTNLLDKLILGIKKLFS